MFEDGYERMMVLLLMIALFTIGFLYGVRAATPTELEKQKGCIVHNNKVYCEVSNIEKGE